MLSNGPSDHEDASSTASGSPSRVRYLEIAAAQVASAQRAILTVIAGQQKATFSRQHFGA